MMLARASLLALLLTPSGTAVEINTVLMERTYHIQGPGVQSGEIITGTAFVVGTPCPSSSRSAHTMLTAAHVLEKVSGEELLLDARVPGKDGAWQRVKHFIRIRDGAKPKWVQHDRADIAALYITLPNPGPPAIVVQDFFATDALLEKYEIHPGDEVFALGFPLGAEGTASGLPILRSGRIASYPILPTPVVGTFLVDMEVFPGNSGGPVYLWDRHRTYGGSIQLGEVRLLVGLVTGTVFAVSGHREARLSDQGTVRRGPCLSR